MIFEIAQSFKDVLVGIVQQINPLFESLFNKPDGLEVRFQSELASSVRVRVWWGVADSSISTRRGTQHLVPDPSCPRHGHEDSKAKVYTNGQDCKFGPKNEIEILWEALGTVYSGEGTVDHCTWVHLLRAKLRVR